MSKSTRAHIRSELLGGLPAQRGGRAVATGASLRSRAGALASSQLRGAAGELLADALVKLEARLRGWRRPGRSSERMREVLERDRALAFVEQVVTSAAHPKTSPAQAPAAPAPSAAASAPKAELCDEPIRTRTMARLLAAQGHVERALAIYAYLLEQHPGDVALSEEADALRTATLQGWNLTG